MKSLAGKITVATMAAIVSLTSAQASAQGTRTISANMKSIAGPMSTVWRDCVGSGHAGLLLRKENQDQMRLVHDETGFEYIRFHGIFTEYTDA